MSVTTEVKELLSTVGNVYIGSMPPDTDNVVCIYNAGGYPRSMSGTMLEEPTFQVRVRNTSYAAGEALCETISDLLHGESSAHILMIQQQSEILDIGRDANNRQEFTINFRCYYRK